MSLYNRRFLLLAPLALAACGFTPAYGPQGGAQQLQGRIGVAAPKDRDAYLLNQRLEDRLGQAQDPAYELSVTLQLETRDLGSTADGRKTRFHRIGKAAYSLRPRNKQTVLTSGEVKNFTGYSASGSTVATLAAERDAQARLMVILADQIVDRLLMTASELP